MMVNMKMPITLGSVALAVGIYFLVRWLSKKLPPPPQPILIDSLLSMPKTDQEIGGRWAIAKPLNDDPKYKALWTRIYHARLVLQGKAQAYQYYADLPER